ncbi:MAG: response regulator [Candidatus Anammoxibacter sp.]
MSNILVIDDDECIHDSFKVVLKSENCIEIAGSGEEGVAKAAANQPDIIFVDLKMPELAG